PSEGADRVVPETTIRLRPLRYVPGSCCTPGGARFTLNVVALPGSTRPDEARLVGEDHKLRAIASAELHHGAADMSLRGRRTHEEPLGNLLIGQPTGDQRHHLALSIGQRVERRCADGLAPLCGELGD